MGAEPDDFHPALQPIARGYGPLFQPQPANGPGLLGTVSDPTADASSDENDASGQGLQAAAGRILQRDIDYLDRYYSPANRYSQQYKVDPTLVLGLASESGFGTAGTYNRTGDAFGMTGGGTKQMTTAASPDENVREFFRNFGSRIYGVGDNVDAFINALQARDANGKPIAGLKMYNSERPDEWEKMARGGIGQIRRDLPIYLPTRTSKPAGS